MSSRVPPNLHDLIPKDRDLWGDQLAFTLVADTNPSELTTAITDAVETSKKQYLDYLGGLSQQPTHLYAGRTPRQIEYEVGRMRGSLTRVRANIAVGLTSLVLAGSFGTVAGSGIHDKLDEPVMTQEDKDSLQLFSIVYGAAVGGIAIAFTTLAAGSSTGRKMEHRYARRRALKLRAEAAGQPQ